MYMIDSNIFIDFLRGKNSEALKLLRQSDANLFKVPSVVKAELLVGALKSQDPVRSRLKVESLLLPFEVVPFDDICANQYARIRANLESEGRTIGSNDYMIAACALAHSAILVTNNVREFKRIPDLAIENWVEVGI